MFYFFASFFFVRGMTIEDSPNGQFDDGDTGTDKIFQNYLMPTLRLYDTRVSINHWQLRDCVKRSSTEPGKVYYIFDHSIRSLDTRTQRSEYQGTEDKAMSPRHRKRRSSLPQRRFKPQNRSPSQKVVDFSFKSRCFQENNGLIVSGGLMGPDDNGSIGSISRQSVSLNDEPASGLPTQVEPIRLASSSILSDHSTYSNQSSWKGILSLYNEENNVSLTYRLGQYINNCVSLHQRTSQQYDLFACNNDAHLYQCDVSNRGVELTRRYSDLKFALNNATISHDGKTMIASGDSSKFAIYHENQLTGCFSLQYDTQPDWGSSIIRTKRIPRYALPDRSGFLDHIYEVPGGDHGFSTSFAENDLQFATVFQNGTCWVYDTRKMETPLAELYSTRKHAQNGAFRVCKFSEGLDDLLFISEHQGRVHVVDTRNFLNHQVIMIPDRIREHTEEEGVNPFIRRNSMPTHLSDPYVTFANDIPVSELEPEILPYPKVVNRMNNTCLSDDSPSNSPNRRTSLANRSQRRRSFFRVRRISTSHSTPSTSLESIDPSILDARYTEQNYRAVDNYNYVSGSARANESNYMRVNRSAENTEEAISDDPMEFADTYNDVSDDSFELLGRRSRRRSRHNESNLLGYPHSYDYSRTGGTTVVVGSTEENHISGIDWMEDGEGSSLIIGTEYGIMKWNINSWARRSFPSYDFC